MKITESFVSSTPLRAVGAVFATILVLSGCSERHQRIYIAAPPAPPAQVVAAALDADQIEGEFLQVATFRVPANRDNMVAKLEAEGFAVSVRPIRLAGTTYDRVVVGPLTTIAEIDRVDRTIIRMGLNDAFFLKP